MTLRCMRYALAFAPIAWALWAGAAFGAAWLILKLLDLAELLYSLQF